MTTILNAEWIVGFVDGEGCFHIDINKNNLMKLGYQALPEFTVVQHESDVQILNALKAFWKCGVVRKNHGNRMCYRVRNLNHLQTIIIPFFEKHKLKTKKRISFERFRSAVLLMEKKEHLTLEGLDKLRKLREGINSLSNLR
uniref:Putative LAGLIDADG homing endonuclease n=1 Tax=Koliella corcontica TaxID=155904 RepID=A0A097KMY6_9CHLO|nr:putative LAGLIDADG homing endonuclease [Koliella corcontica]YP_009105844.1 putative LAGLIDADG homing endonuclease [Koliella corcontica]AIT94538.1 putative LAGLIDADG homing endonuclease [Koliella corcontica]AIT94544.1 putative LAGLIDADG homing endonuclease [Koliella corcontica]